MNKIRIMSLLLIITTLLVGFTFQPNVEAQANIKKLKNEVSLKGYTYDAYVKQQGDISIVLEEYSLKNGIIVEGVGKILYDGNEYDITFCFHSR